MIWWRLLGFSLLSLVIFFYSGKNKNRSVKKTLESPMSILKESYAKGEISKDEFEEQKQILNTKF